MRALGNWSIKNSVTVNLIMVFIIVAGVFTVVKMRREMFPQFALDMIYISVAYPGSSPEEVEEGICIKIEERIEGIDGIDRITSTARENFGEVLTELESGADAQKVLDEIKAEVDRIDTFPEESEEPLVIEILRRDPIISVAVFGDVGEKTLRKLAEDIRDDLLTAKEDPQSHTGGVLGFVGRIAKMLRFKQPDSITQIDLVGVRDYEIAVELSESNLRRYGLSFDQVADAVRSWSVDLPGGRIKTKQGEILVRSKGQLYTGEEFERIPLITLADGTVLRLGQVATVIDGFTDTDIKTRFNGKPAAIVQVNRTSEQDVALAGPVHTPLVEVQAVARQSDASLKSGRGNPLPEADRVQIGPVGQIKRAHT